MRSRSAAAQLQNNGFGTVYSMAGGLKAWQGKVAPGPPFEGMAFFAGAGNAGELVALAWRLEEGARRFYERMTAQFAADGGSEELFRQLTGAEVHHEKVLEEIYREVTGTEADHRAWLAAFENGQQMEGGMRLADVLGWSRGKEVAEVLDLAMAMETASYDLYVKMSRETGGRRAAEVFGRLAEEERHHLAMLGRFLDEKLG